MLGAIILGIISVSFLIIGFLIWKKEKISILHSYHYENVSEENKKAFCTLSGLGIISIGIGLLITAVIIGLTNSALSFIAFAIGFMLGLFLLIYAGKKYNKTI